MTRLARAILEQRRQAQLERERIKKIVYPVLIEWRGKEISKRLATKVQEALDREIGTVPTSEEMRRYNPEITTRSLAHVYYMKDSTWSGEPRYKLSVSSRELVRELPREGEYRQHRLNDTEVQVGTSSAESLEEIIEAFTPREDYTGEDFTKAQNDLEEIEQAYTKALQAVKAYKKKCDEYGEARYIVEQIIDNGEKFRGVYL